MEDLLSSIKAWKREFTSSHGRDPRKEDITPEIGDPPISQVADALFDMHESAKPRHAFAERMIGECKRRRSLQHLGGACGKWYPSAAASAMEQEPKQGHFHGGDSPRRGGGQKLGSSPEMSSPAKREHNSPTRSDGSLDSGSHVSDTPEPGQTHEAEAESKRANSPESRCSLRRSAAPVGIAKRRQESSQNPFTRQRCTVLPAHRPKNPFAKNPLEQRGGNAKSASCKGPLAPSGVARDLHIEASGGRGTPLVKWPTEAVSGTTDEPMNGGPNSGRDGSAPQLGSILCNSISRLCTASGIRDAPTRSFPPVPSRGVSGSDSPENHPPAPLPQRRGPVRSTAPANKRQRLSPETAARSDAKGADIPEKEADSGACREGEPPVGKKIPFRRPLAGATNAALPPPGRTGKKPSAAMRSIDLRTDPGALPGVPAPEARKPSSSAKPKVNFRKTKRGHFTYKMRGGSASSKRTRPSKPRDKRVPMQQAGDCPEDTESGKGPAVPPERSRQGGGKCFRCGGTGHWAQDCPALTPAAKVGSSALPVEERPKFEELKVDIDLDAPNEELREQLTGILKERFGHECFRGKQFEVVRGVLEGSSVLAVLPTGSGKSLCYQLPALLRPGLCLVISPLIALMKDQLERLPRCLTGAMLASSQSAAEVDETLRAVAGGQVKILFTSPERLLGGKLLKVLSELPPLSLICVDEAHCVTEWGHSFRPAFFRLGHLLRSSKALRFQAVLGLTATATGQTQESVCEILGIPSDQVIRDSPLRENLRLGVLRARGGLNSMAGYRAVAGLLTGPLKSSRCIVYCLFQWHADEMSKALYVAGVQCVSYHAGMGTRDRAEVQSKFCQGRIRVVCATIAFGMGLDAQVDAVIHATMPRTLEEYVQQIGRAGRNGQRADCILLLDDDAFLKIQSLARTAYAEAEAVEGFLGKVFQKCAQADKGGCVDHWRVLACKSTASEVDMREEVMESVLAFLQSNRNQLVEVLPDTVSRLEVAFYLTPPEDLAADYPVVAAVLKAAGGRATRKGAYSVAVDTLVWHARLPPSQVMEGLRELAWKEELSFNLGNVKAFAFRVLGAPENIEELAREITERLGKVEKQQVSRISYCYRVFARALKEKGSCAQLWHDGAEGTIRARVEEYFETSQPSMDFVGDDELPFYSLPATICGDVHAVSRMGLGPSSSRTLSVRAIASVLHGISSPSLTADKFSGTGFWGRYQGCDFDELMQAVEDELTISAPQTTFELERANLMARNKAALDEMMKGQEGAAAPQ